jgi:hypothetical protein
MVSVAADSSARRSVVVVGIDGGRASVPAMRRALDEARTTNGLVEMVTAWTAHDVADAASLWAACREARRRAVAHQRAVIDACADALDVPVTGVVVEGPAQDMLVLAGRGAACVVLGRTSPGRSPLTRTCSATGDGPGLEARPSGPAQVPRQRSRDRSTVKRPSPKVRS